MHSLFVFNKNNNNNKETTKTSLTVLIDQNTITCRNLHIWHICL